MFHALLTDTSHSDRSGCGHEPRLIRGPRWLLPVALVVVVTLAYALSLPGGFLNWDDPWLIRDNSRLQDGSFATLVRIWTDLSRDTRLSLGAEYLPLRDLSHWVEFHVFGLVPQAMRAVQLVLYAGAVLAFRAALRRSLGPNAFAEAAAWLFALNPMHVESVAWLAGRKDVLALLFVGLALWVYAGRGRHRIATVPLLLLCAMLSKSMSVAAIGLLPAMDLLAQRRPPVRVLVVALVAGAALLPVHLHVGAVAGMTTAPAGGSRWTAAATMGPVWLRYAWHAVWPPAASLVHDVPIRTRWDAFAIAGWAGLAGTAAGSLWAWRRRNQTLPLAAWLWFFVPLAPVSQIVFPLQNLLADRYLFLSVMAPSLGVAWLATRVRGGIVPAAGVILLWVAFTAHRAFLFSDSVFVFQDAQSKAVSSPVPSYQLGHAWERRGQDDSAVAAYREALQRAPKRHEVGRKATNNIAKLLARQGKLEEAAHWLRRGRTQWPNDPKVLGNLAEVLARQGHQREARKLCRKLIATFPDYRHGVANCVRRFGTPP